MECSSWRILLYTFGWYLRNLFPDKFQSRLQSSKYYWYPLTFVHWWSGYRKTKSSLTCSKVPLIRELFLCLISTLSYCSSCSLRFGITYIRSGKWPCVINFAFPIHPLPILVRFLVVVWWFWLFWWCALKHLKTWRASFACGHHWWWMWYRCCTIPGTGPFLWRGCSDRQFECKFLFTNLYFEWNRQKVFFTHSISPLFRNRSPWKIPPAYFSNNFYLSLWSVCHGILSYFHGTRFSKSLSRQANFWRKLNIFLGRLSKYLWDWKCNGI